jgi:diguanylate cyclase (GGDEF)-like protein/PAS domain S-box-containing protein
LLVVLSTAALYAVTGRLGLALPYVGSNITLFWPPSGIAVAVLFVFGVRAWPGVALGAMLVNGWIGTPLHIAAAIAVGNTLGAIVTAEVLRAMGLRRTFDRPRDVLLYSATIIIGTTIAPLAGVTALSASHAIGAEGFGEASLIWWLGDAVGALLVGPVLLSFTDSQVRPIRSRPAEAMALFAVALACAWMLFAYTPQSSVTDPPLAFLSVVPLVWAAFRFGALGTSLIALLLSIAAASATAIGQGVFELGDMRESLLLLWAYMATIAALGIMINALQADRMRATANLAQSHDRLQLALSSGDMAMFEWNIETGEVFLTEQWRTILGDSTPIRTTFGELMALVHPDDLERLYAPLQATLRGESAYHVEHRVRTPADCWVWIESSGQVIERDARGRALRAIGINKAIDARKLAERALRASEEKFGRAFHSSPVCMTISTLDDGRYIDVNEGYERMMGYARDEVIGRTAQELGIWVDMEDRAKMLLTLGRKGRVRDLEMRFRNKSGDIMVCSLSSEPLELDGVACMLSIAVDITRRKQDEAQMRLASKVFETTADAIVLTDADDRIMMVNPAFSKMTGFSAEEVLGLVLAESPFRPIDPAQSAARMRVQLQEGHISTEVLRYRKDGRELPLWVTASNVLDESGRIVNFVRVFTDISELKASQRQLEALASNDALTALPNRRVFDDRLDHAVRRTARTGEGVALLFIDLDGFKRINDTYGHDAGDAVLQTIASRLSSCIRAGDSLCRLGGDEFAVILEGGEPLVDARRVSERIVEACGRTLTIGKLTVHLSASVGIAIHGRDGGDARTLLKSADRAMYAAKQEGGGGFRLQGALAQRSQSRGAVEVER